MKECSYLVIEKHPNEDTQQQKETLQRLISDYMQQLWASSQEIG